MTLSDWLAIVGAGAGTLASLLTAFSVNGVVKGLNVARKLMQTLEENASDSRSVPVFTAYDGRVDTAGRSGSWLLVVGVALLVAGWLHQGVAVLASRHNST